MKSTRMVLFLSILIHSLANTAWAEFIGLNVGASYWTPDLAGSFSSGTNPAIDLSGDLGLDDPSQSSFQLILEHPIPILPNIKYQRFELDSSGSSILGSNLNFNGTTFSSGNQITSTFDLSHEDIVLYYELLDNWVSLDFGLDIKRFDGEVELIDTANPATTSRVIVDETIPLLYLSARFDLPFSGFYIGADINSIKLGDSRAEDSTIMLGYESGSGLGFQGGIKKFSLELDDANNLNTNLDYDGIFLNGYIHF